MTTMDNTPSPSFQHAQEWLGLAAGPEHGAYTRYVGNGAVIDPSQGLIALRDAQVGTGHAVLVLAEETAAAFAQVPDLVQAIRELTTAVTEGLAPLAAIAPALAEADDTTAQICTEISEVVSGLADLTTEVADIGNSLTTVADAADRPSWWARLRARFSRHHTDPQDEPFTDPTIDAPDAAGPMRGGEEWTVAS
jgi:hypothetical protein